MTAPRAMPWLVLVAAASLGGCGSPDRGRLARVSLGEQGTPGNAASSDPALSADGRWIVFHSEASTLVPDDGNGAPDIFVHDRRRGRTIRVSVDSAGREGTGHGVDPALSADGRVVAFASLSPTLVPGDTNGTWDIFVHDLKTRTTTRVSVGDQGQEGDRNSINPSLSADGRVVAFYSDATNLVADDTNGVPDIFVHDRARRTTVRVSVGGQGRQADAGSSDPALSADGRWVAFASLASTLVPDDTNGAPDIFVHDMKTRTTRRVSVATDGLQADAGSSDPALSADGQVVAFTSLAGNLVGDDTNGAPDVFVHDQRAGLTTRVSVDSAGRQGHNSIDPSLSADGRWVAFASSSPLASGDTDSLWDVYLHDRRRRTTQHVSRGPSAPAGAGASASPELNGNGRVVAFHSSSSNLVDGDTNAAQDVFVYTW